MKRLYRSETDRKLGGICGGIAEYTGTDSTIIRLLLVCLALVTGFFPVFGIYIVSCWIIPRKSQVVTI